MKHNGSYLRQYLPWLGLLLGVDALAALLLLRQTGRKLNGAKWWGKCSTALLYAALFLLLAFPRLSPAVVQALLYLCLRRRFYRPRLKQYRFR